jgi:hypothetical protein
MAFEDGVYLLIGCICLLALQTLRQLLQGDQGTISRALLLHAAEGSFHEGLVLLEQLLLWI